MIKYKIDIVKDHCRIVGCVNGRDVYSMRKTIEGEWTFSGSTCMPSDLNMARHYTECLNKMWEVLDSVVLEE